MNIKNYITVFIVILFFEMIAVGNCSAQTKDGGIPQLEKNGKATQLFVPWV